MPNDHFIRRHRYLLALYLLFVVYGSLVPLHYQWRPWDDAVQAFQRIPFLDLGIGSRADWVANLLLFIPLTVMAGLQMRDPSHLGRRLLHMLWVWPLSVLLAVAIEFTQLYFPGRTVSQNDVFAEALGGLIGATLFVGMGPQLMGWLQRFNNALSASSRVQRVLQAYLLVLLGFSILPLDLTLSPIELYRKWAAGRLILLPFTGLHGSGAEIIYELLTDVLVWVPVGLLWGLAGSLTLPQMCARTLAVAAAIEFLQLFVFTRVTDTTDILLSAGGAFVGAWIAGRIHKLGRVLSLGQQGKLAELGLIPWLAIVLFTFWFPFDFDASRWTLAAVQDMLTRPPLTTYYMRSEFGATNELLRKIGFFIPAGVLLRLALPHMGWRLLWWLPLCVALLIETVQLGIPGKVADLTDAALNLLGAWLGWRLTQWVAAGSPASGGRPSQPPVRSADRSQTRPRRTFEPASDGMLSLGQLVGVAFAMALLLFIGLQSSRLPYNLRELLPEGLMGVASALSLGTCIALMVALPQWLLQPRQQGWLLGLPLVLALHGTLCFALLWAAVPLDSLHDILGAPVLGGSAVLELWGRYVALHSAVMLQVLGALLLVRVVGGLSRFEQLLHWLFLSLLLAWPLHYVVVEAAATDNLVELMSGGGNFGTSTMLALAVLCMALCASSLAGAVRLPQQRARLLALAVAAAPAATALFWIGCEQVIVKYGKVFSAWQFLLSSDRGHYATGADLWLRYGLAFSAVVSVLVALQLLAWRLSGPQRQRPSAHRRSESAART